MYVHVNIYDIYIYITHGVYSLKYTLTNVSTKLDIPKVRWQPVSAARLKGERVEGERVEGERVRVGGWPPRDDTLSEPKGVRIKYIEIIAYV